MGDVLLAGEEPDEGAASLRRLVPQRPTEHGVVLLQRVEYPSLRDRAIDRDLDLGCGSSQGAQMLR